MKSQLRVIYHQSHILDTVWKESESFDLDIHAAEPPSPVGVLPHIVLSRGQSDEAPDNASPDTLALRQEKEAARLLLQQELVSLSTHGEQFIAGRSGHHIYADQPELVAESVAKLVQIVRNRKREIGTRSGLQLCHICPQGK